MEASIQRIKDISPIKGADKLEKATILGWQVVVGKGEFSKDDLCVFVEIDSVLPEAEWSEFMRRHKFRVKTVRLRGTLSQGLAFPLSILPEGEYPEGSDVSKVLGVKHYVKPLPMNTIQAGSFPRGVPQTDEPRVQSVLEMVERLKGLPAYITVKCDGTSCTVTREEDDLKVCSRNWAIEKGSNPYWNAVQNYPGIIDVDLDRYAIQGEVCGPKVQKNRLGLDRYKLLVFDVFDKDQHTYLNYNNLTDFVAAYGLDMVPTVGTVPEFSYTLETLEKLAAGIYPGTNNRREGIVVRPQMGIRMDTGDRLSFKVLNVDYLLKDEE